MVEEDGSVGGISWRVPQYGWLPSFGVGRPLRETCLYRSDGVFRVFPWPLFHRVLLTCVYTFDFSQLRYVFFPPYAEASLCWQELLFGRQETRRSIVDHARASLDTGIVRARCLNFTSLALFSGRASVHRKRKFKISRTRYSGRRRGFSSIFRSSLMNATPSVHDSFTRCTQWVLL